MFDVARNRVSVLEDTPSIVNRTRLLILTEPTELYQSPTFGAGLKRYLFQYNTDNQKSIIRDRIAEQLKEHEPCVNSTETTFSDGLLFTGTRDGDSIHDHNKVKMTVGLSTIFGDTATVSLNNEPYEMEAK